MSVTPITVVWSASGIGIFRTVFEKARVRITKHWWYIIRTDGWRDKDKKRYVFFYHTTLFYCVKYFTLRGGGGGWVYHLKKKKIVFLYHNVPTHLF